MISVLKEAVHVQFNPKIERLDFEVFQNNTSLDITMFSNTKDLNEVFNEKGDEKYFAGSKSIWENLNYFQEDDDFDFDFFYANYEDADVTYIDAVVEWLGRCWDEAGGDKITIPSYIKRHDSGWYFNLRDKKWVKDI